jgi:hypothetical protein
MGLLCIRFFRFISQPFFRPPSSQAAAWDILSLDIDIFVSALFLTFPFSLTNGWLHINEFGFHVYIYHLRIDYRVYISTDVTSDKTKST